MASFGPSRKAFSGSYGRGVMRGAAAHSVPISREVRQKSAAAYTSKSLSRRETSHRGARVGLYVAGYAGYKAYQNKTEIKDKAHQMSSRVHNSFHSTRSRLSS